MFPILLPALAAAAMVALSALLLFAVVKVGARSEGSLPAVAAKKGRAATGRPS